MVRDLSVEIGLTLPSYRTLIMFVTQEYKQRSEFASRHITSGLERALVNYAATGNVQKIDHDSIDNRSK